MTIYIVVALAVVLAGIILYGSIRRKKVYAKVDELEQRKVEIANTPVAEEIGKVKGLIMSGETEEKFERWRQEWDDIVGIQIPKLEDTLFEIDEWADKYRFRQAKEHIEKVEQTLAEMERHIHTIFSEVNELVHSEEDNRTKITTLKESYESMKLFISQNWGSLGPAAPVFEKRLQEWQPLFERFEEETNDGNYMKAKEIVDELEEKIVEEKEKMDVVPPLLIDIETDLPEECREVLNGMKEMEQQGYVMEEFDFRKTIKQFMTELPSLKKEVAQLQLEKVQERTKEMHEYLNKVYEVLEKEVEARQYVERQLPPTEQQLNELDEKLSYLEEEQQKVKMSYRIPPEEEERYIRLNEDLENSTKSWRVVQDAFEKRKITFSALENNLKDLQKEIRRLEKEMDQSKEKLYALRKDEVKAVEALKELRRQILEEQMKLEKSYLPKIPASLVKEIDMAEEKIDALQNVLQQVPVEIGRVTNIVEDASHHVNKVKQELRTTMEQAALAERAIQYGNKYRRTSKRIDQALSEAEEHFRNGYYDEAVTIAKEAMEDQVPDVLEKIKSQ